MENGQGGKHEHGANGLNKQKFPPSPGQLFTLRLGQKKFTEWGVEIAAEKLVQIRGNYDPGRHLSPSFLHPGQSEKMQTDIYA